MKRGCRVYLVNINLGKKVNYTNNNRRKLFMIPFYTLTIKFNFHDVINAR